MLLARSVVVILVAVLASEVQAMAVGQKQLPDTCNPDTLQMAGYESWRAFGLPSFNCLQFNSSTLNSVCFSGQNVVDPTTGVHITTACCICPTPSPTPSTSITPSRSNSVSLSRSISSSQTLSSTHTSSISFSRSPAASRSQTPAASITPSFSVIPANCEDKNAVMIALVQSAFGITISGCSEVVAYCNEPDVGPIVQNACLRTCDRCNSYSPTPSPSASPSIITCSDDDALIKTLARAEGFVLPTGCSDVAQYSACDFPTFKSILHSVCALTCNPRCQCAQCRVAGECQVDQDDQIAIIAAGAGLPFSTCAEATAVFSCSSTDAGPLLQQFCPCACLDQ